jgi:hypothetical protein
MQSALILFTNDKNAEYNNIFAEAANALYG